MSPERWQQLEAIYHAALKHAPAERDAYVATACGGDDGLRKEVESLLKYDPSSPENPVNQAPWQPSAVAEGVRLGPYEIVSRIGAGGMGEVWKARDTRLGRTVAVKISKIGFDQRFEREARAVAALNHPNICTLHDVGPNYFVMEYIDGKPLGVLISQKGLPLRQALGYAAQIADALSAAHAAGTVHRDLKPGNIMVTAEGRVKVVDFGLARVALPVAYSPDHPTATVTAKGTIKGTICYMSPEQAQGQTVDARSDIFSFGSVLYEMLTGARAFPSESAISAMADIIHRDPRPAREITQDLPREVERLLNRCLRKDPARRWQNMADVKVALLDLQDDAGLQQEERAPEAPTSKTPRRRWARAAGWVFAALAGIAAGVVWDRWRVGPQEVWTGTMLGGPPIASHPRISPDGQLLAFRAIVDGLSQVAVMKPDAASWTALTHDLKHGSLESLAWARDGKSIYFDREGNRTLYSIGPLGGEPRLILENAELPEPLADGSVIVLRPAADGRRQLYRFWPDSGRLDRLPAQVTPADERRVCPFPDGKEVAIFGYGGSQRNVRHLFALDLASGKTRDLPGPEDLGGTSEMGDGTRRPQTLAVSADGKSVLTLLTRDDSLLLTTIPSDGSRQGRVLLSFPVAGAPLTFDAAPDGSIYMDQGSVDVWVQRIGEAGRVTAESRVPKDVRAVLPSPDGGFVFGLVRGGRSQLLGAGPGSEPRPLFNTNENVKLPGAWLDKGRLVLVIGQGAESRLAIGSVEDGRILQRFQFNAQSVASLGTSPDAQTIYYAADGAIWSQAVTGGAPRKIGEGYDVAVDPAGESLYVMRIGANGYELWRMPAKGGEAVKIDVPPGFKPAPGRLSPKAVNADGRILLPVNLPTLFFYQAAILDPARHTMNVVPALSQAVITNAGWAEDGTIQVQSTRWSSTLWRYRKSPR